MRDETTKLKEHMNDRVDLGPIIDEMIDGIYEFEEAVSQKLAQRFLPETDEEIEALSDEEREVAREKTEQIWNEVKVERNAIIAWFLHEAWDGSEELRKSFETVLEVVFQKEYDSQQCLKTLESKVYAYLTQSVSLFLSDLEVSVSRVSKEASLTPIQKAYKRYLEMIEFQLANKVDLQQFTPAVFIHRGAVTATEIISDTFTLVSALCKDKQITEEQFTKVVSRAYAPIIQTFASIHQEKARGAVTHLRQKQHEKVIRAFDPDKFSLIQNEAGEYLLFFDHSQVEVFFTSESSSDTTWCPGRYTINGKKDVVRQLFLWFLDLAKKYYFPKLKFLTSADESEEITTKSRDPEGSD